MPVMCRHCLKTYSNQSNYNRHLMETHRLEPKGRAYDISNKSFKCLEGCNISFALHAELVSHLTSEHNLEIKMMELNFTSVEEFLIWLTELQSLNGVEYVKPSGKKLTSDGNFVMYYICSRSGKTHNVFSPNIICKKVQSSKKMSYSCTSQIKLVINKADSSVTMSFCKTHYGHDFETHLRLPKEENANIARKLNLDVSATEILNTYRENEEIKSERIDLLKRKDINNIKPSYHMIMCRHCLKGYSNQSNFNRHLKENHGLEPEARAFDICNKAFKCLEGCNISFALHATLVSHLTSEHNLDIKMTELNFISMEEFLIWLRELQNLNNVEYVKPSGKKLTSDGNFVIYYICSRSGKTPNISSTNKRCKKLQGSKKLNYSCTSQIKLVINKTDSSVTMYFCKTHYGHDFEIQHLRLPKEERANIAERLNIGVSATEILNTYRENEDKTKPKKINLLKRKDINNIRSSYQILKDYWDQDLEYISTSPQHDHNYF